MRLSSNLNTLESILVYLSISLSIFNKINLICKTAGQLLQWPPVVQYQQICNKIFVWPPCPDSVCVSAPALAAAVGRRVVAVAATENYLFAPFAAADIACRPRAARLVPVWQFTQLELHFHLLIKSLASCKRNAGQI